MAQAAGNTTTQLADGLSSWVKLSPGGNRITIESTTWGGSTAALHYSPDGTDARDFVAKDDIDRSAISASENEFYDLDGPGWVAILVGSTGGTLKRLTVERITPVLGA